MASPEVQAVLADPSAFEGLVQRLMSADNQQRQVAEQLLTGAKEQADVFVHHLVTVLRSSQQAESRAFAAVLLRKVLTKDDPPLWPNLSPNVQNFVKSELLNALKHEQEHSNTKKICDTISELAAVVANTPGWPELLPFIFQCVQSNEPRMVESALLIFAQLARHIMDTLKQYLGTLHEVLAACLTHASTDIRVAAMRATTSFIQELEEPAAREKFQPLIPGMLGSIVQIISSGDESSAQDALEMFIEVAEAHPRFLRKQLTEVVEVMLQVVGAEQLEDSTRQLAAEFMVTLCEAREKAPGMMRKLPQFVGRLFQCMLAFLLDVEDEPLWHSGDSDKHESEGEGELYEFGQECLDRLALALGGNTVVPLASAMLPPWLQDPDWRRRHAALICLAQIAEGCTKVMARQLDGLVSMCMAGLNDPHPKVRWASCQALGQMCTDLGPDIQLQQHARILPGLMAVMDDFAQPRVQAHAAAAVVNFSENCDSELLEPYLDTLINKLLVLLQNGKRIVQEGALTAMASVADASKQLFVKYYDSVMPLLRHILVSAADKSTLLLRAKALECISLVGMAVGRDRFRPQAHEVMHFMQSLQGQTLESDDPTSSYMLQAGARICKCLGEEFLPYLSLVMPPLLASAQLATDYKVTDADSDGGEEDDDDDEVETIYLGDRKISIRTSVLEEKATACNMLCCYAQELAEGFYPYVEQVTQLMVPLLKFYFHEEVRQAAVQSMPQLLRSAQLAAEKGKGPDRGFVQNMFNYIWPHLMAAMQKEPDMEVMSDMLEAVEELLDIAAPALVAQEQLGAAFERFQAVAEQSAKRRAERLQRLQQEDFDEEEAAALEEENEEEEVLLDGVASCLTVVLKKYGDSAMPFVDALMPALAPLLDKRGHSAEERRIGICIMDDILENARQGGAKYAPQVIPILLEACSESDANLRQCSAYGLGVAAQQQAEALMPHARDAVQRLVAMVNQPNARSEDNESATENAVSALGKILEHCGGAVDGPALGAAWLAQLPLRADLVEAKVVHEQLIRLIQQSDPRILGEGNANLPKIVAVIIEVLGKGTALAEPEVIQQMVTLLQQMQGALPGDVFQGLVAQLKPKERENLRAVMAGQAPPMG